jgi:2-amino-4-hydroxy-6-hydroxymethyldihydropteridine diphosphokinase
MATLPKRPTFPPVAEAPLDVVVGLGSNLGDRRATLAQAVRSLDELGSLTAISSLYETAPIGPAQPDFLNAAVRLLTAHSPVALLQALLDLERRAGRERRERWGPRTLDLDILWIRALAVDEPGLTVPHAELVSRAFALLPLLDVAPDATDPRTGTAYRLIAGELASDGVKQLRSSSWPPPIEMAPPVRA